MARVGWAHSCCGFRGQPSVCEGLGIPQRPSTRGFKALWSLGVDCETRVLEKQVFGPDLLGMFTVR